MRLSAKAKTAKKSKLYTYKILTLTLLHIISFNFVDLLIFHVSWHKGMTGVRHIEAEDWKICTFL